MKSDFFASRPVRIGFFLLMLGLAVGLRVYRLETDAYPGLSWDTGLFTDEGFYLHNARNVILFGQWRTDEFNNVFLMPLFHGVQLAWFRAFGVGSIQTRMLSITLGLLTLPLYFDAVRRLFGSRVGGLATLFLALDHTNLLYSRMGLMDPPAAFALVTTLWAFSRAVTEAGKARTGFAILCGILLGVCYGVRGLTLFTFPAFLVAISGFRFGLKSDWKTSRIALQGFIIGLFLFNLLFAIFWYFPKRAEIARLNAFYLNVQVVPHSFAQLGRDVGLAVFGVRDIGLLPYLLSHSPVLTVFSLFGFVRPQFRPETTDTERQGIRLFRVWLGAFWILLAVSFYAPSRYYVLFYPAMFALAAHQLDAILSISSGKLEFRRTILFFLLFWGIVNGCWLAHWLVTMKTTRRDAEAWLTAHLPPNTVLLGDVAPGLALDSRFRTVNVQPVLCNDREPLEVYRDFPRAIIIPDLGWKEAWWTEHYPDAVSKSHRIALFNPVISRPIGIYYLQPGEIFRENSTSRKDAKSQRK